MADPDPTVDAVADYCQTQARLLAGRAQTLSDEIDELLEAIDSEAAAVRERLDDRRGAPPHPDEPVSPDGNSTDETADEAAAVERLEAQQATVADKQARLEAIGDLSGEYVEIADALRTGDLDTTDAITRVLEVEAEADAPSFFDERETLLETATDQ